MTLNRIAVAGKFICGRRFVTMQEIGEAVVHAEAWSRPATPAQVTAIGSAMARSLVRNRMMKPFRDGVFETSPSVAGLPRSIIIPARPTKEVVTPRMESAIKRSHQIKAKLKAEGQMR